MSTETANAARFKKGMTVLSPLEGELLEALEALRSMYPEVDDMIIRGTGAIRGFSDAAIVVCIDADLAIKHAHGSSPDCEAP